MSVNDDSGSRSSPSPPQKDGPDPASSAAARLLRKRELDRKSQRMARDRTRARMAHLEKLVEEFKERDTNGHVELLMQRVTELGKDRDNLAKVLQNIRKMANNVAKVDSGHSGPFDSRSPLAPDNSEAVVLAGSQSWGNVLTHGLLVPSEEPAAYPLSQVHHQYLPSPVIHAEFTNVFNSSDCTGTQSFGINTTTITFPNNVANLTPSSSYDDSCPTWDPIIPLPQVEELCDCSTTSPPYVRQEHERNLWRYSNEILTSTKTSNIRTMISYEDEASSESLAIKAILHGWDFVSDALEMHPSLQTLRKIDEALFYRCGNVERLAIILLTRRLLHSHAGETPKVPSWYKDRPSQAMLAHSYAIDFLTWPGVRERFVFSQHRYCSNSFWKLFRDSFKIVWPFEFRDCYSRNTQTGLYQTSPTFGDRVQNINCWAMKPDMFRQYPEFYGDIPSIGSIPGAVSSRNIIMRTRPRRDYEEDDQHQLKAGNVALH